MMMMVMMMMMAAAPDTALLAVLCGPVCCDPAPPPVAPGSGWAQCLRHEHIDPAQLRVLHCSGLLPSGSAFQDCHESAHSRVTGDRNHPWVAEALRLQALVHRLLLKGGL